MAPPVTAFYRFKERGMTEHKNFILVSKFEY